jgi:K+-sensing histidine kinase KdpD
VLFRSALGELDRAVNGGPEERPRRPFRSREVVIASIERWRPVLAGREPIKLYWDAGPAIVVGDPVAVAQAFDNLIANAIEHGGPPLVITGAAVAGRLRITVANGVAESNGSGNGNASGAGYPSSAANGSDRNGDGRRGHGIEVVSAIAAAHGGRFALCRSDGGCVAALELPLAQRDVALAA